ncbi:MAG TPA: hypothetical protein VFR47_27140 [Anaerolineales bacterium]|nr:hypothetical protein [Anaerolineales bacterium]
MKRLSKFTPILILLFLISGSFFSCSLLRRFLPSPPPPPQPEPISAELKADLCEKLDSSHSSTLCSPNKNVLAKDIFPLFENRFKPGVTTYREIYDLLGFGSQQRGTPYPAEYLDLAGNGVNRIFIWSDHESNIKSIVFIRPDQLTPLDKDTVVDLCERLELARNSVPCTTSNTVYAQDFFPSIEETFMFEKIYSSKVKAFVKEYQYEDPPLYHKAFFRFRDNVNSQVLFYYNQQWILENMVFIDGFIPTPLDSEVLSDLCNQLSIEANSDKCKPGTQVYTTDLIKDIRKAFPRGTATYDDVQAKIGKYQTRFDPPVRDATGRATTLSWYDFVGNNFTRIRIDFDTNFVITQIQFFVGGGS